jgi:glycosyl transferase family 25
MSTWHDLFIENTKKFIIPINNIFPNIYYINLKSRTDRYVHVTNELTKYSISAKRFNAIKPRSSKHHNINRGQLGCLLSHKEIILEANNKKYNYILILEDDIIFQSKSLYRFHEYWLNLPNDWDMLYLSGNNFMGLKKINDHIFKSYGTLSTCAYAIRNTCYEKILSILDSTTYTKPIDSYYVDMHQSINAYVCVPSIAYQRPDFSDIENRYVDYSFLK